MNALPSGWTEITLGEIAAPSRRGIDPRNFPEEIFDLYSVPAYDAQRPDRVSGHEIGSAKQLVQPGDVMISKIVPHIRRVWVVPQGDDHRQIASGEWITYRSDAVDSSYLRHFLLSDPFHHRFMQTTAGVGGSLTRARPRDVARLRVPLPPLPEQRRIATILDKASRTEASTAAALSQTRRFTGALFQKQFADARAERAVLAEVLAAKLTNGRSPAAEGTHQGDVLTLSAVTSGRYLPEHHRAASFDKAPSPGQYASSDHFLISRGNGNIDMVGVGVVANGSENDVVFPDTVIGAPINREIVEPDFLEAAWASPSVRSQIRTAARTTNGTFKVNQTALGQVKFPLPPLETQRQFTRHVQYARRTEELLMRRKACMSRLITALQSRAFRGEL